MRRVLHIERAPNGRIINLSKQLTVVGRLLLFEAAFMLVPLAVCVACNECDWLPFLCTAAVTAVTGLSLTRFIKPQSDNLGRKDGCMITCMVWIVFSLFGMLPFVFGSSRLNISEGFFETMSGFTTTGATVIRNIEECGKGLVLWRAMTQWIGGLGIVVFTLAIIPSLNNSKGLFMFHAEVSGITHDKIGARIANTAKMLWLLYGALTTLLVLLLWAGPMTFFESVCHAFSAISTGGYSTRNESVAAFDSCYVKVVLSAFMFIGGVNFGLIYAALRRGMGQLWKNDVFRAFVCFILLNFLLTVVSILHSGNYNDWQDLTVNPVFHVVSAMTSTGFGAGNFELWGELSLVLTIVMMYFGACAGSTTGGAKLDRLVYMMKNFKNELKRSVSPRSITSVSVNGQMITPEHTNEIIAFLTTYTALILIGGILLAAFDFPIVDAFFSSISCVSNNGLGAGVTGVSGSYDLLPNIGKWVMSFLMLAGRLEIFALIVLLTKDFWKR